MRLKRKRRKSIKVALVLPISILISGAILFLAITSHPKQTQVYPTVLSWHEESIFSKLLSPTKEELQEKPSSIDKTKYDALVESTKSLKGTYSIYVKDLAAGDVYSQNPDQKIFAASLYKIPTAISTLKLIDQNKLKLTDTIVYTQEDLEGGTGILNQNSFGTYFNVEQLLTHLLKNSDNVAENMLSRRIGYQPIYQTVSTLSPYLNADDFSGRNIGTSRQIGTILENSVKQNYLKPESKKYFFDLMFETSFDDRIAPYIVGDLKFSHKIGSWADTSSWHDCGVVFNSEYQARYVICLMTEGVDYNEFLGVAKGLGELISYEDK